MAWALPVTQPPRQGTCTFPTPPSTSSQHPHIMHRARWPCQQQLSGSARGPQSCSTHGARGREELQATFQPCRHSRRTHAGHIARAHPWHHESTSTSHTARQPHPRQQQSTSIGHLTKRLQPWRQQGTCSTGHLARKPQLCQAAEGQSPNPSEHQPSSEVYSAPASPPSPASAPATTPISVPASTPNSSPTSTPSPSPTPAKPPTSPPTPQPSLWRSLLTFLDQQCLPLMLITMLCVGLVTPEWGQAAAAAGLTRTITVGIFVLAGLQLRRGEAAAALKAWGCVTWGLASILLLTPLLALVLRALPVPPSLQPLVLGTAVFCAMPTTLSSGISMTTAAGGNTALAILLTIASNLLGVITLPVLLPLVCFGGLGGGGGGSVLSPALLLRQLCETVLLPTLAGAVARSVVPGLAALIDGNKRPVVYVSSACLAVVPWMQVSRAVGGGLAVPPSQVLLSFGLGVLVHVVFLAFNWVCVAGLNLGGSQPLMRAQLRQALVLQASQKTLPVAIAVVAEGAVAAQLGPVGAGLAALGAVAAHLAQVLVDSLLVPHWTAYIRAAAKQQEEMLAQ